MTTESPHDAVKSAFFERLSHPVMGVFLLALVVCNWRSIVCVVVSDANAEYRITQASSYANCWTLFLIPAAVTLVYVLLAPVFKVLALMWDRAISNWENVRAYQAKISVVARNTAAAEKHLAEVENAVVGAKNQTEEIERQMIRAREELARLQNAMHDLSALITPSWQAHFPGMHFPVDGKKNPTNYKAVTAIFDRVDTLKRKLLVNPPT